ncbi:MAG TPA: hypothetical protein VHS74_19050 [Solirubrobacterales bacterium]|jgi:hypothetical protein|nr:hypothetical protein [Solirubrobacterales bacterium]
MRARAIAVLAALGVLVALALAGGAVAKPGFYKTQGFSTEQFQLRGTGGYRMQVVVVNHQARVTLSKRVPRGTVVVDYSLRRRLPPDPDLHFQIGDEGEVNLRFVHEGKPEETTLPHCKGGPQIAEKGVLVGTLRFRGKTGFTRVEAHRVPVVLGRSAPMTCRRMKTPSNILTVGLPASGGEVPEGWVQLIVGGRPGSPQFGADLLEAEEGVIGGPELPEFFASISRREGGSEVISSAFLAGTANSFGVPESLEPPATATVEPPAPFSGSATFQMTSPHHAEWSGDLTAELPGYGRVRLTGPKVRAGLCKDEACTPTLPKSLRPLTGSGKDGFKVSYFNGG